MSLLKKELTKLYMLVTLIFYFNTYFQHILDLKQANGNKDTGGFTDENGNKNRNLEVVPGKYGIDLCNCCTLPYARRQHLWCCVFLNISNFVKVKYFLRDPSATVCNSNTSLLLT